MTHNPQVENGRRVEITHPSSLGRRGALVVHGEVTMVAYEGAARVRPPVVGDVVEVDGDPVRVLHYEAIDVGGIKIHQLTIEPAA